MTDTLHQQLKKINQIRSIDKIMKDIDLDYTIDYYSKTNKFYRKYHSKEGSMHFALKMPENNYASSFEYQAQAIASYLDKTKPSKVVELGCGPGFNTRYIAQRHPLSSFSGIDLTPLHVQQAREEAKDLSNVSFSVGDFEKANQEREADIVFSVETTCHAHDIANVFTHSYDSLKPGGKLIFIDAYLNDSFKTADKETQLAADLFAQGFAVKRAQHLSEVLEKAQKTGFEVSQVEDLTQYMIPNVKSVHDGCRIIYRVPPITKLLLSLKLLPNHMFRHSISGILGPHLFCNGYVGYYKLEFNKK